MTMWKYVPGTTTSVTSAYDTVTQCSGVCRDFAHLGIALCRALTIPARYFTGYAHLLDPPDFHACVEAFIGGYRILFDPTRLAPPNGLVRIGLARDAADVSVCTVFGIARTSKQDIQCEILEENFHTLSPKPSWTKMRSPSIQTGMSRIRIVHSTTYRYSEPVAFGLHRLIVRPREGHDIQVEDLSLRIRPSCAVSWHRDIFGNSVAIASFSESSDFLEFVSDVTVFRRDHTSHYRLLDILPVSWPVEYSGLENAVAEGYLESVYPEETGRLRDWTMETFSPRQGDDAVLLVREITRWIYRSIRYRRRESRGVQTPLETLRLESGSCRDMATLLLEIARSIKIASRFASGYLDSEASLAGRAATHAWTEIYFPEHGWFGCDPTLGEETSQRHIVSGVSSHPRGVMPISGAYSGPTSSFLGMTVSVKIAPFESLLTD